MPGTAGGGGINQIYLSALAGLAPHAWQGHIQQQDWWGPAWCSPLHVFHLAMPCPSAVRPWHNLPHGRGISTRMSLVHTPTQGRALRSQEGPLPRQANAQKAQRLFGLTNELLGSHGGAG